MNRSNVCSSLGVRTAQVFTVFSVLDSTEGERCQVGSRFSPTANFLSFDFRNHSSPHLVSKRNYFGKPHSNAPHRAMCELTPRGADVVEGARRFSTFRPCHRRLRRSRPSIPLPRCPPLGLQ